MSTRFGNPELLKKKYGDLKKKEADKAILYERAHPVKVKKQELKITLPSEPSLILPSVKVVEEVEINPVDTITTDTFKHNLLNFIDTSKLVEGRPGFKAKSYFLKELQHLAKLLGIFKNEKNKIYFIEGIQKELKEAFGEEPNLIGDIKELSIDDIKKYKPVEKLFIKHHIAEPTKTDLLGTIKRTIKQYYTSDELVQQVINEIEKEWKPTPK